MPKQRLAIIGSGISGIASAYLLQDHYDVTLFEAESRLGGHTRTVYVETDDGVSRPVDTGFIVFNLHNYPLFSQFLSALKVPYRDTDMAFGYWDPTLPLAYCSDFPKGIFAMKRKLFSRNYLRFLKEIGRFNSHVTLALQQNNVPNVPLKDYLNGLPFSKSLFDWYVIPMGAAIWSCSAEAILEYDATAFFSFWQNHCLLQYKGRPQWKTIQNGSIEYIRAFVRQFPGRVVTGATISAVSRAANLVTFKDQHGQRYTYDKIVIATHADHALAMLTDPTKKERDTLSKWTYTPNTVHLHRDSRVMPPQRRAWASWSVHRNPKMDHRLTMTYYMNRLQPFLPEKHPLFVTLNDRSLVSDALCLNSFETTHPKYTLDSLGTQEALPNLLEGNTLFCGAYFGNGFHEDGMRSAVLVAKKLGITWPRT